MNLTDLIQYGPARYPRPQIKNPERLYLKRVLYGQHQVSSIAFVFGPTDGRLLAVSLSDPFVAGVLSEKAVTILSEGLQICRFRHHSHDFPALEKRGESCSRAHGQFAENDAPVLHGP